MKKKKYLPFYEKCMKTGFMPESGLCNQFDDILFLFTIEHEIRGFWGYDGREILGIEHKDYNLSYEKLTREFTPLRQTVVLLMAAMNNEL